LQAKAHPLNYDGVSPRSESLGSNGQTLYNPDPEVVLSAGDTLILVGPAGALSQLEKMVMAAS